MYTASKYKIWDLEEKVWFKPTYPRTMPGKNNKLITTTNTQEILFSQAGDLFMHEHSPEKGHSITDLNLIPRYIPCAYTGFKDCQGRKIYENDVMQNSIHQIVGVIKFKHGCFFMEDAQDEVSLEYLADVIKANCSYIGNILETPTILELI